MISVEVSRHPLHTTLCYLHIMGFFLFRKTHQADGRRAPYRRASAFRLFCVVLVNMGARFSRGLFALDNQWRVKSYVK